MACRQLGLGYANHGLQVSEEERETQSVVTKVCASGKGLWKQVPWPWKLGPMASPKHLPTSPRRPGTGTQGMSPRW